MPTRLDNFRPSSLPVFLGNNCHHPHIPGLRAPDSQLSDPSKTLNTAAKNHVQRRHSSQPRTHIKARRSASCTPDYGHHDFVGFDPMSRPTEVTPLLNPVYSESDADTREDLRKAQTSRMSMFGEELKTLLQYTGPIFGYVVPSDTLPTAQTCYFRSRQHTYFRICIGYYPSYMHWPRFDNRAGSVYACVNVCDDYRFLYSKRFHQFLGYGPSVHLDVCPP